MKKRNLLTKGIYLINKKYKKNEFYHFIEEPSNSLIIPILKNKKFILVKQKREPINKINYEFPMGWIDKGENSISTAKRELLEETGYKSIIKPKKIMVFYPDPGRNRRKMYCFYTDKIEKISCLNLIYLDVFSMPFLSPFSNLFYQSYASNEKDLTNLLR